MEKLLTERQVAEILGRSLGTIRGWRARGDYPVHYIMPGGKVMVSEHALQTWLDTPRPQKVVVRKAIQLRESVKGSRWIVRWTVDNKESARSFVVAEQAAHFQLELQSAVKRAELFDAVTGEPVSWKASEKSVDASLVGYSCNGMRPQKVVVRLVIQQREAAKGSRWIVTWTVDKKEISRSFGVAAQAADFQLELQSAVKRAERFDVVTGEPISWKAS